MGWVALFSIPIVMCSTPFFILEPPLVVNPREIRILSVRFEAGRQLYNAVLGESLRHPEFMKQSRAWGAARKMPKGTQKSWEKKARSARFALIAQTMGVSDYDLQSYATHRARPSGESGSGHKRYRHGRVIDLQSLSADVRQERPRPGTWGIHGSPASQGGKGRWRADRVLHPDHETLARLSQ